MRLTTIVLGTILAGVITLGSCEKLYQPKEEEIFLEYKMKFQEYKKDRYGNEYFHQEETIRKASNFQKI